MLPCAGARVTTANCPGGKSPANLALQDCGEDNYIFFLLEFFCVSNLNWGKKKKLVNER